MKVLILLLLTLAVSTCNVNTREKCIYDDSTNSTLGNISTTTIESNVSKIIKTTKSPKNKTSTLSTRAVATIVPCNSGTKLGGLF